MKFTCESCDAKYRIPDEKIRGRVLRMKCRRCGYPIVIKPGGVTPAAPAAAVPPRHEEPRSEQWHVAINEVPVGPMSRKELQSHVAAGRVGGDSLAWCEGMGDWRPMREIASLSSLLRGASPGAAPKRRPAPPPRSMRAGPKAMVNPPTSPPARMARKPEVKAPLDEVPEAISEASQADSDFNDVAATVANDVPPSPIVEPVVPVAATGDSWPDLKQPEFERPKLGQAAQESSEPSEEGAAEDTSAVPQVASTPEPVAEAEAADAPELSEDSSDELSLEIGSPVVVAPTPAPQNKSADALTPAHGRTSTASLVDIQAQLDKQTGQPSPLIKYLAMVIGGCIIMMVGVATFVFLTREEPTPVIQAVAPESPEEIPPRHPQLEFEEPEAEEAQEAAETEPEDGSEVESENRARRNGGNRARESERSNRRAESSPRAPSQPELTEEQREMMRRMGGGLANEGGGANIAVRRSASDATDTPRATGLTQDQLRTVVGRGQRGLRQCYERSIRGQLGASAVRINVSVTISRSGRVQSANAAGQGAAPGLTSCVEANVRRWQFPAAGASSQTRFPVVFAPGS